MTEKLQHFVDGWWQPFHHANTFVREWTGGQRVERLRIGPRGGQRFLFQYLAATVGPPHKMLYVLHTTRTDATLGRYESPWIESEELVAFLDRFGDFIAQDSRHDLWALCGAGDGTIVWDRHDLLYAYGPLGVVAILGQTMCKSATRSVQRERAVSVSFLPQRGRSRMGFIGHAVRRASRIGV